ncbi:AMP-binding protein [Spiractinospora alimapuensis]|uniref:AMP-binding protein n=1 Tax=Spiractinospora alimapuensis TaxID=2820884 RepID=UPI001F2E10DA|nr:AMP-binding protein [Spiractinospora alimapuensis]QVQ52958.1 AMP-binding protein [Spiractinospora alimapuensis]
MLHRPLQALLGIDGAPLLAALDDALRGHGPALLPIAADTPPAVVDRMVRALRPATIRDPDGVRDVDPEAPGVGEDVALVVGTSGSTGTPKGVELPGAAVLASARASLRRIGDTGGDWLCVLPTTHIAGIQVMARTLVGGGELLRVPFSPDTIVAATAGRRPHVSLVPTQLRRVMDAGVDLSVFATIALGGAPARPELLAEARAAGGRIVTTYGMTETAGGCVYDGTPLSGVRVDLDSAGRIHLGGEVVASGYRLRPDLTRDHMLERDGTRWFATSDLGAWDESGRLVVRGRADDVIITGGHNVQAQAVASSLQDHPRVADAVVVGRPDPEWGESVVAVVVPRDGHAAPGLSELRDWTRRGLPHYAAPRELQLRSELPMLASGKPDLARLRAEVTQSLDVGTSHVPGTSH